MGGATRFITLLTTPFQPLRPSLRFIRRHLSTTPPRPLKIKPRTRQFITSFHSQPINNDNNTQLLHSAASQNHQHHHPWAEWNHFLNFLSNFPDHGIPPEDAFVVYEELPHHFTRAAASSLALARARPDILGLLSRGDIEAVVSNGTPFLFKSALDTARRMRAFLGTDGSTVSEFDKATTVDLMKYILSYASNPIVSSERKGLYSRELVDSSVRNLLRELVTISNGPPGGYVPSSSHHLPGRPGGASRPLGPNIEMKRGDWICPKCDFMNFAKNMKCLECEESRPKKQLTGGEWECPQCNFFNYGKNSACLRCDCSRPGAPLFNNVKPTTSPGYSMDHSNKATLDSRLTDNKERAQDWFSRISQLHNVNDINVVPKEDPLMKDQTSEMNNIKKAPLEVQEIVSSNIQNKENEQSEKSEGWFKKMAELHDVKDLPSSVSDEDFPEIMPMRKGENRFVVSKKKDRSLTSPKYKRQVAMDEATNTNFVPFVPFPPGYFSKKDTGSPNSPVEDSKSSGETLSDSRTDSRRDNEITSTPARSPVQNSTTSHTINSNSWNDKYTRKDSASQASAEELPPSRLPEKENVRSSWTGKSLEGSAVKETDPLDMSEEAKTERWFKRVAQIKDISELSQIPDEDFPSIMPMRKGVNRFVVSKRKTPLERRLTSQQYRRNLPTVNTDSLKKEGDE